MSTANDLDDLFETFLNPICVCGEPLKEKPNTVHLDGT